MGDNTNLFTLLESAINAIKKPELVQKIIALKEKVIVDSDISNLCSQILKLNDTISSLYSANEKIRCELAVVKIVNTKLEERIISLEKNLAKSEQYTRHNNIELSGIPSDISEDNLDNLIDICHDSGLEIEPKDIEGFHRLPVSRYSRDSNKRVIVKFVNRKYPEALLRNKKFISSKDFFHLTVHGKVLFLFLFLLTFSISGVSTKTCKENRKFIKSFALYYSS